jgi:hypothetical protein
LDGTADEGAVDGMSETHDVDEVRLIDRIDDFDDFVDSDEEGELGDVSSDEWALRAVSTVIPGIGHFLRWRPRNDVCSREE